MKERQSGYQVIYLKRSECMKGKEVLKKIKELEEQAELNKEFRDKYLSVS